MIFYLNRDCLLIKTHCPSGSCVVVSGSRDSTLRVWDIDSGECLKKLEGHVAAVRW